MKFTTLPKGYSDAAEQKKQLRIQNYIHYRGHDGKGNATGKYYAAPLEEYTTPEGDRYELNCAEVDHLLKTGRFKRIKKGDINRREVYE